MKVNNASKIYRHELIQHDYPTTNYTTSTNLIMSDEEANIMFLNRSETWRRRRQKCLNCCKRFTAMLFSHVGLCALVVAYSIMGGFLFQAIEIEQERKDRMDMVKKRNLILDQLMDVSNLYKFYNSSNASLMDSFKDLVNNYTNVVTIAVKERGWDGKGLDANRGVNDELQWSYAGALLYSITVITTIGYGHVAPKTIQGRLLTMLYAIIGIPLTFLYLSNIGNFLADCFRFIYSKFCCDLLFCKKREREKKREEYKLNKRKELMALQKQNFVECGGGGNMNLKNDDENDDNDGDDDDLERNNRRGSRLSLNLLESCLSPNYFVRETAILDDLLTPTRSSIDYNLRRCSSTSILNRMDNSRETAIIEDESPPSTTTTDPVNITTTTTTTINAMKSTPINNDKGKKKCTSFKTPDDLPSKNIKNNTDKLLTVRQQQQQPQRKAILMDNDDFVDIKEIKSKSKRFFSLRRKPTKKRGNIFSQKCNINILKETNSITPNFNHPPPSQIATSNSNLKKKLTRHNDDDNNDDDANNMNKHEDFKNSDDSFVTANDESTASSTECLSTSKLVNNNEYDGYMENYQLSNNNGNTSGTKLFETKNNPRNTAASTNIITTTKFNRKPTLKQTKSADEYRQINAPPPAASTLKTQQSLPNPTTFTSLHHQHQHQHHHLDDFSLDEEKNGKVRVPISVCLILIASYILGGSVLFTFWENWDLLTGSYFCFVTLSTIGFGDYVPGTSVEAWSSQSKLVLCALWLSFGLSLLAMCFNLMQEEVKEKCKWLGMKIGILKDED